VEAPCAPPHGPAVPYFTTPPWPPVRALHCRVEELQPARFHLQEELGGVGVNGALAGQGGDSWRARVHLHVAARRQPRGPPPAHFPGGLAPYYRETPGWALLWTSTCTGGRTQNKSDVSDRWDGREQKVRQTEARREYVSFLSSPLILARLQPGKGGRREAPAREWAGQPAKKETKEHKWYREWRARAGRRCDWGK